MKTIDAGALRARVAGGTDGDGGGDGSVVVLLHGFGAPGDDLVGLWRTIRTPRGTRFVFPEAPLDLGPMFAGGRAWWAIDLEARMARQARGERDIREIPEGLVEAREKLDALVAWLGREFAVGAKIALGGFSQGAMLSLDFALHSAVELAGLVLWSGTHLAADDWKPRFESRRGLPVFMSHGESDEVLPFDVSLALQETLVESGLRVEWRTFRGGHGIPPAVADETGAFLSRVLG